MPPAERKFIDGDLPQFTERIVQNVSDHATVAFQRLQRRPRFRRVIESAIKVDSMLGEEALIPSNREAAIAENNTRRKREAEEREARWEEEYNRPENIEKRRLERDARYMEHISRRKEYASEILDHSKFDFSAWLQEYIANPDLVTVEVGHGCRPLAQYHNFIGRQAYIGVEAHMNIEFGADGKTDEVIDEIKKVRPDENIFFVDINNGYRETTEETYDPQSILPDGAADVVFVSHVFDDPQIGGKYGRADRFLEELARITATSGNIVVSEYHNSWYGLPKESLEQVGLQVDQIIFWQDDPEEFRQMHQRFHIWETPDIIPGGPPIFGFDLGLDPDLNDRYRDNDGTIRPPVDVFYIILSKKTVA